MIASKICSAVWLFAAVAVLVGCENGEQRHAISGTLTIDGKPVDDVSIIFTPVDKGLAGAAEVFDARFSCSALGGPTEGMHDVRISPNEAEMEEIADDISELATPRKPRVPLKYQRLGGLRVEITGDGDQVLKLNL